MSIRTQKKKKENGVTFTMKLMRKFIHATPGFYIYFSVGIEQLFCVGNSYVSRGQGASRRSGQCQTRDASVGCNTKGEDSAQQDNTNPINSTFQMPSTSALVSS